MPDYVTILIIAAPRLAEALVFVVAAGVSLLARRPARRADARRVIRMIRDIEHEPKQSSPRSGRAADEDPPFRDA